jgi:phosphate transport system substrate-binding protein
MAVRHLAAAIVLALAASACVSTAPPAADPLAGEYVAAVAESAEPIAERLTSAFAAQHPGMKWVVKDVGPAATLALLNAGEADAGFLSRDITIADRTRVQTYGLGYTAQVLIVHPSNPVTALSQEQVRGIFSGAITDWSEVGGAAGRILVIVRPENSPTRAALEPLLRAAGQPVRRDAISTPDWESMLNAVSASPRAIGMASAVHLEGLANAPRAIAVEGIAPTKANVASATYAYRRLITLVFPLNTSLMRPAAKAFRDFVRGEEGQRILGQLF